VTVLIWFWVLSVLVVVLPSAVVLIQLPWASRSQLAVVPSPRVKLVRRSRLS
jgi:hypothetical protein